MIYFVSLSVFSSVILVLVGMLLFVESRVASTGENTIIINDDQGKAILGTGSATLLSAFLSNGVLLPSACGGKGTCGTCKCKVEKGGGGVLPTELAHLSRKEQQDGIRLACQLKVKEDLRVRIPDEIFNIKKYHATVVSNQNVATFIKELVLKLDPGEKLDFQAGAFIQIDIPEFEASFKEFKVGDRYLSAWENFNLWDLKAVCDEPVFRAYSLANPPTEKSLLKFTIRIATPPPGFTDIPPGVGSSFVFHLQPGDKLTFSGPYGDFFVKNTNREMCFIGGGAGMAPMRSHLLHLLATERTKRIITFWYGARSLRELFYNEDFSALAAEFDNFTYTTALSAPKPEDNWTGPTGYIHRTAYERYLKDHPDPSEIEYYLCGPPPMIDAVEHMLDDLGVDPEMIAYDKFG